MIGTQTHHIDLIFTSIKESREKCGASFDIPIKEAMWFVDQANSDVGRTCFDHGRYNVRAPTLLLFPTFC